MGYNYPSQAPMAPIVQPRWNPVTNAPAGPPDLASIFANPAPDAPGHDPRYNPGFDMREAGDWNGSREQEFLGRDKSLSITGGGFTTKGTGGPAPNYSGTIPEYRIWLNANHPYADPTDARSRQAFTRATGMGAGQGDPRNAPGGRGLNRGPLPGESSWVSGEPAPSGPPDYSGYGGRLFSLGPEEESIRQSILSLTGNPQGAQLMARSLFGGGGQGGGGREGLFGASQGYGQGLRDWTQQDVRTSSDTQAMDTISRLLSAGQDPTAANTIRGLLSRSMQGPEDLETQGLQTLRGRTDPNARLATIKDYIEQVAGPEARAASVAGGMGGVRGGAFQEGLAREGSRLSLPLMEMIDRAQRELGGAEMGLGGSLVGRRADLAGELDRLLGAGQERQTGLASSLFEMGRGLEARGQGRRELALRGMDQTGRLGETVSRLGGGLDLHRMGLLQEGGQAASLPRLTALQDYLRRQDLTATSMLGIPVSTGGTTSTKGRFSQDFTIKDLIGLVGAAAGAFAT